MLGRLRFEVWWWWTGVEWRARSLLDRVPWFRRPDPPADSLGAILSAALNGSVKCAEPEPSPPAYGLGDLRARGEQGDLSAQQALYQRFTDQLVESQGRADALSAAAQADYWAAQAQAQGDKFAVTVRAYVGGMVAGLFEGEPAAVEATAGVLVLLDRLADEGDEEAAAALLTIGDKLCGSDASKAYAMAAVARTAH